jgi:hypothetical protein
MSLTDEWDDELHRAEAVLEDDTKRFGRLVLVADEPAEQPKQDVEDASA